MGEINPGISLAFVNTNNATDIFLPETSINTSRVLQIKSYGNGSEVLNLLPLASPPDVIQPSNIVFNNTFHLANATLQANPERWDWNQFYFESGYNFQSNVVPTGTPTPVPLNRSFLAVDLRTESKTLILPLASEINENSDQSRLLIIKDKYGSAQLNPLFIQVTPPDLFENASYGQAIRIKDNYACIQIVANAQSNVWTVLSYYNGNQT
jgi:hypothetical protein